ncbi:MAG: hypothetical protein ABSA53_21195 [Streptosporangiaceae bacterium]|jgi:hypothetical protein
MARAWIGVPGQRLVGSVGRLEFVPLAAGPGEDPWPGIDPLVREIVGLAAQSVTPFQLPAGIDDFTGRAVYCAGRLKSCSISAPSPDGSPGRAKPGNS